MKLLRWLRGDRRETRAASGTGFTAEVMAARESYITGRTGLAELTATTQSCVSLWEGGLSQADVTGTDVLTPQALAITGRSLALRGEAVFLIADNGLVPVSDWTLTTRDGEPQAYRLTIPEAGGGRSVTALAAEVLHVRVGSDPVAPWTGTPPLRRASLSAGLLHALEAALSEVYQDAPLGSQVVPYPETPDASRDSQARSFRGKRGRVLLRESTTVTAAGGPTPQQDWRPSDLTPDLSRSEASEALRQAREAILNVYGVLPAMIANNAAGPTIREGQRHLAQWTLAPVAAVIASEATAKLGESVTLDVLQPLQAYDAGGRARAMSGLVQGLAAARQAGLSDDQIAAALKFAGIDDAAT